MACAALDAGYAARAGAGPHLRVPGMAAWKRAAGVLRRHALFPARPARFSARLRKRRIARRQAAGHRLGVARNDHLADLLDPAVGNVDHEQDLAALDVLVEGLEPR